MINRPGTRNLNPKSETRNSKQIRMTEKGKIRNVSDFDIRVSGLGRPGLFRSLLYSNFGFVSDFEIRVSYLGPVSDFDIRAPIFDL